MEITIGEVLGIPEKDIEVLTKGFSLGLLMGSCLQKALASCVKLKDTDEEETMKMTERLVFEKENEPLLSYPNGLTHKQCESLLQLVFNNQAEIMNNLAL